MSKERLEEIDKRAKHRVLENSRGEVRYRFTEINTEDFDWLIEQAEQNEELSVALNNANKEILVLNNKIKALKNKGV